ncbi:MAG: hypothetical protein WCS21_10390 [Lachnospiraceae bacterium]
MNQVQFPRAKQALPAAEPQIIVDVGGKIWKVGPKTFASMVETAKEAMRQRGQCAIVAVGKGYIWTMEKTTFADRAALDKGIHHLQAKGMQVKSVRV